MAEESFRAKPAEVEARISEEILKVQEESYGVGASAIKTHYLDELIIVIIDVDLTPAERTLLDAGNPDAVKRTREDFQAAIEATFTAIVEHATGRKVTSFLSSLSVDPLYAVELFRLDPVNRYTTS